MTTINKTLMSLVLAKLVAENILNLLPKNIHEFEKFVAPETLIKEAKQYMIELNDIVGFRPILGLTSDFKPTIKNFQFTKNIKVNFGISGIKIS